MLLAFLALQATANAPLMIFFDSGASEVRREWEPVLDQAATLARSGQRLLVTGHSDTPGSAATNLRMARQRAAAVMQALIARGVPASSLQESATGETELLVPTADGVREIQNRRVDIQPQP